MPINAENVYQSQIVAVKKKDIVGLKKGKANYSGLQGRVSEYLSSRTAQQQFEFDVALWYGYLTKEGGAAWKKRMVLRLMAVLYYGGLMVNRGDDPDTTRNARADWQHWSQVHPTNGEAAPICSAISHTARVTIWLPENDSEDKFGKWFWGGSLKNVETRGAATHGIDIEDPQLTLHRTAGFKVVKGVKELKGNKNAKHFGVNIALGGNGNIHPISGKGIRENGKHGHLYIASYKNEVDGRRAILVATEQSAPFDRQKAVKGHFGRLKSLFRKTGIKNIVCVPDQYGGGHGLGGHSRFSATGGDDFSYKETKKINKVKTKVKVATKLEAYGPSWGNYIDGMYIDLTARRFRVIRQKVKNGDFTSEEISLPGVLPLRR